MNEIETTSTTTIEMRGARLTLGDLRRFVNHTEDEDEETLVTGGMGDSQRDGAWFALSIRRELKL